VKLTTLEYNPHTEFLIPLSLLTSLDHLGCQDIGKNEVRKVIDSIVVSLSVVGETEWSDSDSSVQVEDIESFEFGREIFG